MMATIKRLLTITLLVMFPSLVYSQKKDFGIWYCLDAEIGLNKKLDLDLSGNIRTFKKASEIEEGFGQVGLTYSISKKISLAGSYRLTDKLEDDSSYHLVHKWFADIKGNKELGKFSFSGRFRFQKQKKTYIKKANDLKPDYHGRIKFSTKYKTPSFPINPYISFETFFRLFEATEKRFDKNRFTIGMEYKMKKKHSFELEYIFQRDYLPHLSDISIVSLVYNFKI